MENIEEKDSKNESSVAAHLKDILEWGGMEALILTDKVDSVWGGAKEHIMVTVRMFQIVMILNLVATILYLFGSWLIHKSSPDVHMVLYIVKILVSCFCITQFFLIGVRAFLPIAVVGFAESSLLVVSNLFISASPDFIVNIFDKDRMLRDGIKNYQLGKPIDEIGGKIFRGLMSVFTAVLLVDMLVITLPLFYQSILSLLIGLIAISYLVFSTLSKNAPAFWLIIFRGLGEMYAVGLAIYYLALKPFMLWSGLEFYWGTPGKFQIFFWLILFLVAALLAIHRFHFDTESSWPITITPSGAIMAALLLLVGLGVGGIIIDIVTPKMRVWKQEILAGKDPFEGRWPKFPLFEVAEAAPNPPSSPSTQHTPDAVTRSNSVYVSAKDYDGVESGFVVKSGDKLEVSSSGKAVWKNIPVGNPTKYEETGPSGTMPNQSPLMSESEYWSNIDQYLCSSARKGALIAKVGDGPWFYIGDNYKGDIKSSGKLIFAINDLDPQKNSVANWQDNEKGFQVAIKVK